MVIFEILRCEVHRIFFGPSLNLVFDVGLCCEVLQKHDFVLEVKGQFLSGIESVNLAKFLDELDFFRVALCTVPVIVFINDMKHELTVFIGLTESDAVDISEGDFSFDCVLGLESDEFADKRLDEAGTFCDVVNGLICDEEDTLLDHFLIVDFLDQCRVLDLLFLV